MLPKKQHAAQGIITPASMRKASGPPVSELVQAYRAALVSLGRDDSHVNGTVNCLPRMMAEIGW